MTEQNVLLHEDRKQRSPTGTCGTRSVTRQRARTKQEGVGAAIGRAAQVSQEGHLRSLL